MTPIAARCRFSRVPPRRPTAIPRSSSTCKSSRPITRLEVLMSSHRESPEISKDPAADNAYVYAFVSPDDPRTCTLISNVVPLQDPHGCPNFFGFGDDV